LPDGTELCRAALGPRRFLPPAINGDHAILTAAPRTPHADVRLLEGMQSRALVVAALALAVATRAAVAHADPNSPAPEDHADTDVGADGRAVRSPDATYGAIFRGPFASSRLFAMPTADVVGAYILSLSGDGSLLQKPGVLTSAGVVAIGFGDIAQVEYRHTEAIGISNLMAPVPSVGVQLKLPIPERSGVPAIGVAFRLGVPRTERLDDTFVHERVSDLYIVARERFAGVPWLTLHGGARISSAKATPTDDTLSVTKTLVLPTAGVAFTMNAEAQIVGEVALAPQFQWMPSVEPAPVIRRGLLGRLGMKWRLLPAFVLEGSLGYQLDDAAPTAGFDAVVSWDIRLGAAVFVPWGALACRAVGVFCE
jgi:hypothetical protein